MSKSLGNVLFLGIARIEGKGIVVASCSFHGETDLGAVKQVLDQPNTNLSPGKHYSFSVGQLAWHLIADDKGFIYILISHLLYPQRCAYMGLEELQRTFSSKHRDSAVSAKENSLNKSCRELLLKICKKYDDLSKEDKLSFVAQKVDSVKLVMQENVELALKNCVKLESIERSAEDLSLMSNMFRRNATDLKNKMWWKNMKMKLIIGFIILALLGIIIGVIVATTSKE